MKFDYQVTLLNQKSVYENEETQTNGEILKEFKVSAMTIFIAFEQAKNILQSLNPCDVEYSFSSDYKRCDFKLLNESSNLGLEYVVKLI